MEQVILKRAANSLFADELPDALRTGLVGRVIAGLYAWCKQQFGGLWVGGTVTVTSEHVRFEPNAMNRALTKAAGSFRIPHDKIRDVRVERGVGTNIVVLTTDAGEQRFRCYKAETAAQAIRDGRRAALT